MNISNKFFNVLGSILMISVGIKILITHKLSQGNGSMGGGTLELGSYAYLIGLIFIVLGVFALFFSVKHSNKKE